ncbi:MAG: aminoglycoside phosphotransferase family protein [Planctomycetota bacterium]
MKREPIAILREGLSGHPAVRAWRELAPAHVEPECVEVMRERRKSSLYRLLGVGVGGSAVVAKRGRASRAAIERTVYEEALPHLPVSAPRFYGSVPDGDGTEYLWLFLEDVGAEKYSRSNEEHLALAGRWLGRMHASATRFAGASRLAERLPDGGPSRYLEHLRSGRRNILANVENPSLTVEEVDTLRGILRLHDRLESAWPWVEGSCEGLPPTLVHNDFRPKNAYVRSGPTGLQLFPIDWETAGWGLRAADLTRVGLDAYASALEDACPGLDTRALPRMAHVGQVFRFLAAIGWESPQLSRSGRERVVWTMVNMKIFRDSLSTAIEEAGLPR